MEWATAFVSGSAGVVIGISLTIIYDYYKDFKIKRRVASAIRSEINTLIDLAKSSGIVDFEKRPFQKDEHFGLQVNFNYFIVFESNANLISLLDRVLAKQLIEFYSYAKQILDLLKLYEEFSKKPNVDIYKELEDIHNRIEKNYKIITNLQDKINVQIEKIEKERFLCFFK